jgi:glycosyltransferase involved in cell wall biosynthesis
VTRVSNTGVRITTGEKVSMVRHAHAPNNAKEKSYRILQILGDSKCGGAVHSTLDTIQLCAALGVPSEVLATDVETSAFFESKGVIVKRVRCICRDINIVKDVVGLVRLYWYLRKERYMLVHTHTSKAGVIGRIAARLAGVPIVVHTVHGFAFHEATPKLKLLAMAAIETIAAAFCDQVIFVSNFHAAWARRLGICDGSKSTVILNGANAERARAKRLRAEVRSDLGVGEEEIILFSAGRLASEKGIEYLLGCLKLLPERIRERVRVILAGDGPLRVTLEHLAVELGVRERVTFLGFRNDIGDLLGAADLVVFPTEREGLSIALLEAMSSGKVIVTTTIGSNIEVTRDGECAVLIPPRDSAALAAAISEVVESPDGFSSRGTAARQAYTEMYTQERMRNDYSEFFLRMLDDSVGLKRVTTGPQAASH